MHNEISDISLVGDRGENQDRVAVVDGDCAALLVAVDGMGGHADGARAAEVALETVVSAFGRAAKPLLDPQGFLHLALSRAHDSLVALGAQLRVDARPRATCALALVQDGRSYWAHVGDSRVYLLRDGRVLARTRDHSHVELLLQQGLIGEHEMAGHPMRNYVECCLGGHHALPGMSLRRQGPMHPGDLLLVCSDGFWSGLDDTLIAGLCSSAGALGLALEGLARRATQANHPHSDNTSAAVLRWLPAASS
ncbi:MAG: serine/threonine-protein phosphatase [Chromatiales bacterium]|nr:serine/threonine-protein phosphatase [Chromatiales bacterium]